MPRNEEGEFELVLGNRQLLSVFFIVVVLLGVFFVMGYILGKNSSPNPATEVAGARSSAESGPAPNPIIIDKSAAKESAAAEAEPAVEKPVQVERPVERAERIAKPVEKAESKKPEPKKEEPKREESRRTETKAGEPPKGSLFLQVAAVGRAEADVVAKVLKGKGYSIWIAPSDKETIFRVLVGPIQKSELGKTRSELNGLGFAPFPRSY
ncbi:SPOR domain-containing protein [Bryobacter aggregatus]|uniref:SPOR domain-containing protein n=1 Tax=Bryobacter aggregatus TaxID=360054 RepID=UPI0004E130F5|nr:SPOR domain-containing protein [Bryobacter aggregatus]